MNIDKRSSKAALTQRGEVRRAKLLEVAAEEFLAAGFAQTSMMTIVRKAGGSATTAYQLFDNKEGLLRAVLQREFDGLEAEFFPADLTDKPPREALPIIGLRLLGYLVQPRSVAFYRLLVSEGHRIPGIAEYFRQIVVLQIVLPFERYLRDSCARGELSIDDPANAAYLLGNLIQGMANEARISGGYSWGVGPIEEQMCRSCIESILQIWIRTKN
ncbi:hypothetical protein GQ57_17030 [Burkholderia sp. MSh2]|uniref:TetR family transcriptional regulator n=1 Tax=Burkholderia paludis TaxID=1506587 RepID=A0A6J5F8J9_9BURK|nr:MULTISPECIES: TetR/AcrR family transcriptional regulator [Burkholderia]KEZ04778.1 hypothetical protein GQ57_17030 [Burkholderia sp. MSh2]KFG94358.1 hypothetical protein GQ56_0126860 [Burkholderia paludis]CAB3773496.1 hypothetical protein LMG30113_07182 [Burkholderia paludis]VWC28729.1 TetR family transcriptional regulator [Burkholderia paludis]